MPVPRVVIAMLVVDAIMLVPLGLVLVWLGVVAPVASLSALGRAMVAGMGIFATVLFATIGLGLTRYNVLGKPPVRLAAEGVAVGEELVSWDHVGRVGAMQMLGVPFLTIELDPSRLGRVAWFDRAALRFSAPPAERPGPIWITEQQLGCSILVARAFVPPTHLGR